MNFIEEFLVDLRDLSEKKFFEKYDCKIPKETRITDLVKTIELDFDFESFIQNEWDGKDHSRTFNINETENGYTVFQVENGGAHWVTNHVIIKDAIFDKIDRLLNSLMYVAPDSVFQKPRD